MRKISVLFLSVILIAGFTLQLSAQEKTDYSKITGTWNIVVTIQGADEESAFIVTYKNDTLKAIWSSYDGDIPFTKASFEKDTFTGILRVPSDYDYMDIEISATIDGDKMKGKGVGGGMEYPFSGKRKKDK